jgi:hypothetical protein
MSAHQIRNPLRVHVLSARQRAKDALTIGLDRIDQIQRDVVTHQARI